MLGVAVLVVGALLLVVWWYVELSIHQEALDLQNVEACSDSDEQAYEQSVEGLFPPIVIGRHAELEPVAAAIRRLADQERWKAEFFDDEGDGSAPFASMERDGGMLESVADERTSQLSRDSRRSSRDGWSIWVEECGSLSTVVPSFSERSTDEVEIIRSQGVTTYRWIFPSQDEDGRLVSEYDLRDGRLTEHRILIDASDVSRRSVTRVLAGDGIDNEPWLWQIVPIWFQEWVGSTAR